VPARPQLHQLGEDCVEVAFAAGVQDMQIEPERAR
jgi:hypothetical protein